MKPPAAPVPTPRRILVVPDKFKGTLSAAGVSDAIARGWTRTRPGDRLDPLPMSDGGDGFGEVMGQLLRARARSVKTVDAALRPIRARWWWVALERLAILEAAQVNGLARLPRGVFHPWQLDTFGLGRVLQAAVRAGARQCLIGIGGSATNDGGFGLARSLGWKFYDRCGGQLESWTQLDQLDRIERPGQGLPFQLTVAVDVGNPLLGPRGCTRVYGPQKGLLPGDLPLAERCLHRLKVIWDRTGDRALARTPGAGAAGGLGFGLMAFADAHPESGFELFAAAAGLEQRIRQSDLVITGEGAVDQQTAMGKGVGQVLRLCRKLNVPCLTFAGMVEVGRRTRCRNPHVHALTDFVSPEEARRRPAFHLARLSALAAAGRLGAEGCE